MPDDDVDPRRRWDVVRLAPEVIRSFEAGPDGLDMIVIGGPKPEGVLRVGRDLLVGGEGAGVGRDTSFVAADSQSEWRDPAHALGYLARADAFPHRAEGEGVLLDHVPHSAQRILDLGTGDGRQLALLRHDRPDRVGVGVDVSEPMLRAAAERFADQPGIELLRHDLAEPIPELGSFDAVVSCFAIHHLPHARKRSLYAEVFDQLVPGGVFCNLEHVASPTSRLHSAFYEALGYAPDFEDPSNHLLDVQTQLDWLRDIGFSDVDCYWKWLEMALLIGVKSPADARSPRAS